MVNRSAVAIGVLLFLAPTFAGCFSSTEDAAGPAGDADVELVGLTAPSFSFGDFLPMDIPSFDGVPIHVDIQLPDGEGPFPLLLQYTPYSNNLNAGDELWGVSGETGTDLSGNGLADYYVPRGYAVGIAHVRGSGQSGGCFTTGGPEEAQDGYEIVEALAAEPWSNGRVAMMGTSYVGTTPISTATLNPPHLTTIVPVSAVSEWYRYYFENGEPRFFGELPFGVVYTDQPLWASIGFIPKPRSPTQSVPDANKVGCAEGQLAAAYAQDNYNDYWMARNYVKDLGNATASMLYAHGFLDENTAMSLVTDFYNAYPAEKRMWLQQHGHGVPGSFEAYHASVHQWLDYYLLDRNNGALTMPAVVIQDNRGEYHTAPEWPVHDAANVTFMLDTAALVSEAPADSTDSFIDDPRSFEETRDALGATETFLTYRSEPVAAPLHLSGAPRMELVASSSARDTQWSVLLYDESPDGARTFITRGYLDARHAESLETGRDATPGQATNYTWELHSRDHQLETGHRLVLILKSSDKYILPDTPGSVNTVYHGAAGSRLVLPVLDVDATTFTKDAPHTPPAESAAPASA